MLSVVLRGDSTRTALRVALREEYRPKKHVVCNIYDGSTVLWRDGANSTSPLWFVCVCCTVQVNVKRPNPIRCFLVNKKAITQGCCAYASQPRDSSLLALRDIYTCNLLNNTQGNSSISSRPKDILCKLC